MHGRGEREKECDDDLKMEGVTIQSCIDIPAEAMVQMRALLSEKASDLFAICDQEQKGFVTKRDMQGRDSERSHYQKARCC